MKRNFGPTFGRTEEGYRKDYLELEKRLKEQPQVDPVQTQGVQPITTPNPEPVIMPNTQINTDDFIQLEINGIHGNQALISPYELQDHNNLNYGNTHIKLLNNGLYMPTPYIFMNFFKQVISAYDNKTKMYTAKGKQLSTQEITDMYKHLTKNHIDIYKANNPGAWTWLNGKFIQDVNTEEFDLETVIGLNNNQLVIKKEKLKSCLNEDCFVKLDFNNQGLALQKDPKQKYHQGTNIYFWSPVDGRVARFDANSDRAYLLVCLRNPSGSIPALGVFGSCEATQKI